MRVMVLGGTGAIGTYLVGELLRLGCEVVVTSRLPRLNEQERVKYVVGNARDISFLRHILANSHYDAVVDFMVRSASEFESCHRTLLRSTDQYVFLSSYRVYAESPHITENSPRLLDVCQDEDYLATNEYALDKARSENILRSWSSSNWTIVRPSVTFSRARFQLGTLEAADWLWRWQRGLEVPLASEMLKKQATLTWGGDAAWFIARLIGSPAAFGEVFNVCTSEHQAWRYVLETYQSVLPSPLHVHEVGVADYQRITGDPSFKYDRMYDRIVSNKKVLEVTGRSQVDLKPLKNALAAELSSFLEVGMPFATPAASRQARMDRYLGVRQDAKLFGASERQYRLYRNVPSFALRVLRPLPSYLR